ncbi:MAG: phage holin family protein [Synergistaceae bacterium]|nr:phage holin family protein [Synergistaceae bacterium]
MRYYFDTICSAIGAIIGYFIGDFDGFIHGLLTLVVIDYISGVLAAIIKRELSSSVGFTGIARKIMIFMIVGVAHVVDREALGGTALSRDAVIFFYLANEGLSIIENAIEIGIPIPEIIKEKLALFHEKRQ